MEPAPWPSHACTASTCSGPSGRGPSSPRRSWSTSCSGWRCAGSRASEKTHRRAGLALRHRPVRRVRLQSSRGSSRSRSGAGSHPPRGSMAGSLLYATAPWRSPGWVLTLLNRESRGGHRWLSGRAAGSSVCRGSADAPDLPRLARGLRSPMLLRPRAGPASLSGLYARFGHKDPGARCPRRTWRAVAVTVDGPVDCRW